MTVEQVGVRALPSTMSAWQTEDGRPLPADRIARALGSEAPRLLVVQNTRCSRAEELSRVVPLVEALLAVNPQMTGVLVSARAYLYGSARLDLLPIEEHRAIQTALQERFDVVISFCEAPGVERTSDAALAGAVLAQIERSSPLLAIVAGQESDQEAGGLAYRRIGSAGIWYRPAPVVGADPGATTGGQPESSPHARSLAQTERLLAALGISPWAPPRMGEAATSRVLAAEPDPDGEAAWAVLVDRDGGSRPVALVAPFDDPPASERARERRLDQRAHAVSGLIQDGYRVVVLPTGEPGGLAWNAEALVRRLRPSEQLQVCVAPDPAATEGRIRLGGHARMTVPYTSYLRRVTLTWVRLADLVVAGDGWVARAAHCLGRPCLALSDEGPEDGIDSSRASPGGEVLAGVAAGEAALTESGAPAATVSRWAEAHRLQSEAVRLAGPYPADRFAGRGIVMVVSGLRYFACAWVTISVLRRSLGCRLPIQVWHFGDDMSAEMIGLLRELDVECVDLLEVAREFPIRTRGAWQCKTYALLHSPFREVLLLDADDVMAIDPEVLLTGPEFRRTGALFQPDLLNFRPGSRIWEICRLPYRDEPEMQGSQIYVDKARCWQALHLALHMNQWSELYYEHIWGDKDTYYFAWRMLDQPFSMVPHRARRVYIHHADDQFEGILEQYDVDGRLVSQHRAGSSKWTPWGHNIPTPEFPYESACLDALRELERRWIGRLEPPGAVVHLRDAADFIRQRFVRYCHVGVGERTLELLPDGTIGQGADLCERWWRLDESTGEPLLVIQGEAQVSCVLRHHDDGVWRGTWLYYDAMRVEVLALAERDPD